MRNEIRTFVALRILPNELILNQLESFKAVFKDERISWVSDQNFHLTLRFIGDTTREQLYELVDRCEIIAEKFNSFEIEIKGAGYFKSKGKPRVLLLKISDSLDLRKLAKDVEKNVGDTGFHNELKSFRPHLTLGRIKYLDSGTKFCSILDELVELKYQKVKVSEFILYQSVLKPEGRTYNPIKIFKLQ